MFKVNNELKVHQVWGVLVTNREVKPQAAPLARSLLPSALPSYPNFTERDTSVTPWVTQALSISDIMVLVFLAQELILNSFIVAASNGSPCFSSSSKYFSAPLRAACLRTLSVSTGTVHPLDKLSLLKSSATFGFSLSAFSTSSRVVDTDRAVFIDAAVHVAGDADCRICLGVALIFSHAVVKNPALTRVSESELDFVLDSRSAFHCDIANSGSGTSSSLPVVCFCCSSKLLLLFELFYPKSANLFKLKPNGISDYNHIRKRHTEGSYHRVEVTECSYRNSQRVVQKRPKQILFDG